MITISKDQLASAEDMHDDMRIPGELYVLPLENQVIFPSTVYPVNLDEEHEDTLIDRAVKDDKFLGCMYVKDGSGESLEMKNFHPVGTVCRIVKIIQLPNNTKTALIQGIERFTVESVVEKEPFLKVRINVLEDTGDIDVHLKALAGSIRQNALKLIEMVPSIPDEAAVIVQNIEDITSLVDIVSANLSISLGEKVSILAETGLNSRFEEVNAILARELEMVEISDKINRQVKETIDQSQKEYYLREQMKAIQQELGESDEQSREIGEFREKVEQSGMPEDIKKSTLNDINRMGRINPASPEYPIIHNHVEMMLKLPWGVYSEDSLDLQKAAQILDEDHYDLESVKDRIIEYLAVRKLKDDTRGPILCFMGPPGVGKTSLGQSIARAMGRKFVRMSLGGVRDEAEIRGHRRTYIGAMPGRIIQGIQKAGTQNPLFMLDEIDKIGMDFRGDPTSALLEVLDPAQNSTFEDHYLGEAFDLSRVMFICTGNETGTIPRPLLDRMEVIRLPGYTPDEKLHIAKRYLVPRQKKENGLEDVKIRFTDAALKRIITSYTREAGVRNLEREIANVCRVTAKKIVMDGSREYVVKKNNVDDYLGPEKVFLETVDRTKVPGVAVGLAWTPVGGQILFIEVTKMRGSGKLILTGKLGDIMKESARASLSYIQSKAADFGIDEGIFNSTDFHIHIPAGAIPKDGPSAGVALFSAILSSLTEKTLPNNVAMTGEITLRGLILPVGGIKEKLVGAENAGIKKVYLPKKNEKDLQDVPERVRENIDISLVNRLDDVVKDLFQS